VDTASVYQAAGTNTYAGNNTLLSLSATTNSPVLPPLSVTTLVLNQYPKPPRITSFRLLGGSFAMIGTNGNAPGTYCYTLASTRLALSLTNWSVMATNQSGSGSSLNITNPFNPVRCSNFFMLRLP
jgi:hypothetical protein